MRHTVVVLLVLVRTCLLVLHRLVGCTVLQAVHFRITVLCVSLPPPGLLQFELYVAAGRTIEVPVGSC
jgi:hypothetical protein